MSTENGKVKEALQPFGDAGEQTHSVSEAAAYVGVSEPRMRALVRKGTVTAEKGLLPGSQVPAWRIRQSVLDAYKANKGATRGGGRGVRGQRKYVVSYTQEQFNAIKAFSESQGYPIPAPAFQKSNKQAAAPVIDADAPESDPLATAMADGQEADAIGARN